MDWKDERKQEVKDGCYVLELSYMYDDDKEEETYNADTKISLRCFPHVGLTLADIFADIDI